MAIIIFNSRPSAFIGTPTPLFRETAADVTEISRNFSTGSTPPDETITFTIKNYQDDERYKDHTDFRLAYDISGDDFLEVTGMSQDEPIVGGSKTFGLSYYNFPLISSGHYAAEVRVFIIANQPGTGAREMIDTFVVEPEMNVESMDLVLDKYNLFVQHSKDGAPVWTDTVNVTCSDVWTMLNSDEGNLSSLLINDSDQQHWSLAGNQSLTFSLSPDVNELDLGYYLIKVYFYQPSLVAELNIHLVVTESGETSVHPDSLDFEAIRYYQEADEQQLHVYSSEPLTVQPVPSWLTVVQETFPYATGYTLLKVKPVESSNLLPGIYETEIDLQFTSETLTVPVRHVVYGEWNVDYDKDVHFTRDNEILELFSQSSEESYVRLEAEIKVYDYEGAVKTFTREWSLAFLNSKAEINLGREVDDYLELLKEPRLFPGNKLKQCYKPLSIKITAREIRYVDETIVAMYRLPYQYYLRGRRPKSLMESFWLNHNPSDKVRVTAKSRIYLNVFKGYGEPSEIQVKRNGELVQTIGWATDQNYAQPCFMSRSFNFSNLTNLEAGEVIGFAYNNVQRNFIVLPEQRHSLTIAWISQWETMESFEFTGEIEIPVEYSPNNAVKFRDWQEVLKKIENNKVQKMIVNTGWIFKNNIRIIDDLISAQKAFWMPVNVGFTGNTLDEWFMELVPVSKKMAGYDSKSNLYQFEVEFQINRKHEDAIYLR